MPASRSRTEHWLDCLKKLTERNGALEISVDRGTSEGQDGSGSDVVWRCKVLSVTDQHILIEPPAAFGAAVTLEPGISLVAAMTIGQNRWMFHTRTLGHQGGARPSDRALILAIPEGVERRTRRNFYRISTANLHLPTVQCWPLMDPTSVVAAEASNRTEIAEMLAGRAPRLPYAPADEPSVLPDVGPGFRASLLNVSGGGLGLLVSQGDSASLNSRPFVWIRLDLRPHIPMPAAVTARIAHTHIDPSQNLYAGLAFDFAHNPPHRKFIVDVFAQYIEALQRQQKQVLKQAA